MINDNLIVNNSEVIVLNVDESDTGPLIENNTISNNTIGIQILYGYGNNAPTLTDNMAGNNIYGNTQYNLQNELPTNINAAYNWWGTSDPQGVNQTIYDSKDNFDLGTVNYIPILTAPNSFAPTPSSPQNSTTSPTPTLTLNPTPTTQQTIPISGSTTELSISGNITSSQISDVSITTNQSALTTSLSFTVTGVSSTTGFGNITIPKSAVPYGNSPTIYIDGQPAQSQGYTQDSNNYYVWFTTHFSTHQVSITFLSTSPTATPSQGSQSSSLLSE